MAICLSVGLPDTAQRSVVDDQRPATSAWRGCRRRQVMVSCSTRGLPGEGAWAAIADVLFGDYITAGKCDLPPSGRMAHLSSRLSVLTIHTSPRGGRSNWKGNTSVSRPGRCFRFGPRLELHHVRIQPITIVGPRPRARYGGALASTSPTPEFAAGEECTALPFRRGG